MFVLLNMLVMVMYVYPVSNPMNNYLSILWYNCIYSQTYLKGSPKERTKSGCIRQVTPNTGSFALYLGSRDLEKVAA